MLADRLLFLNLANLLYVADPTEMTWLITMKAGVRYMVYPAYCPLLLQG
jgi:hypothetical protein